MTSGLHMVSVDELPRDARVCVFDDKVMLQLMPGENQLTIMTRIEDAKGHPGQIGQIQLTNVRLIWYMPGSPQDGALSVGFRTIKNFRVIRTATADSLELNCRDPAATYSFVFNSSGIGTFLLFERALRNYEASSLLREQKLRSSLVVNGNFLLMDGESVVTIQDSLANFSGDVAKMGRGILTNLRFAWMSEIVTNFNLSVPLILLPEVKTQASQRFGRSLYLRFISNGACYTYGFTAQPEVKLTEFAAVFEKVRVAALRSPLLTKPLPVRPQDVASAVPQESQDRAKLRRLTEDLNVLPSEPALRYLAMDGAGEAAPGQIVFDRWLGLAVEEPVGGEAQLAARWKAATAMPLEAVDAV